MSTSKASPGASTSTTEVVRGGLRGLERTAIVGALALGVILAVALMIFAPRFLAAPTDYQCPSRMITPRVYAEIRPSCQGVAGADGIDDQALDAARTAVRTSFGVLAGALLAGAAAVIGVVVSNHNARLSREALNEVVVANRLTEERDTSVAARERARTDDERFASAIEQLGHLAASVRLGGLHSLHRLAVQDHDTGGDQTRLSTVMDVFCAYLRQPFHHPGHDWDGSDPHDVDPEKLFQPWHPRDNKDRDERDAEREVRRTAVRLMMRMLPDVSAGTAPSGHLLDVNLSGAMLDDLVFHKCQMGSLDLSGAYVGGSLVLGEDVLVSGEVELGDQLQITGTVRLMRGAVIRGSLSMGKRSRVDESIIIEPGAHVMGSISVGAGAQVGNNVVLSRAARVDGALILEHRAVVVGNVALNPGARIMGSIEMQEGSRVKKNFYIRQGAQVYGDFYMAEGALLSGDFAMLKKSRLDGQVIIMGDAEITGKIHLYEEAGIENGLELVSAAKVKGGLVVAKHAYLSGALKVSNNAVLGTVRLHDEAAVPAEWFTTGGVPVVRMSGA